MERVVITGASSGIGAACVSLFQAQGVEVLGLDKAESSSADDHLEIDLSEPDCGERLIEFCGGRPIDGLVNNAGIGFDRAAVDTSAADFDHVIAVNLRAPFLLACVLQPMLANRKGFVVNVASVHAVATSRLVSAYAASKGGLVALTRALAVEWAPDIRVNVILPGAVQSKMLIDGLTRNDLSLENLAHRHPIRRVGDPEEIAQAILFLTESAFATGSALTVDGGATAHLSTE